MFMGEKRTKSYILNQTALTEMIGNVYEHGNEPNHKFDQGRPLGMHFTRSDTHVDELLVHVLRHKHQSQSELYKAQSKSGVSAQKYNKKTFHEVNTVVNVNILANTKDKFNFSKFKFLSSNFKFIDCCAHLST